MRIPDPSGTKSSILASIGPVERPGILLSAHLDVVPVEGQPWTTPPLEASPRHGRIYGRGTTDMKGFVAVILAHVERFRAAARETPVHLAFSYDEELGCLGAPDLAKAVAALPRRPAFGIVGEPTGLKVVRAHKGKLSRRVVVTGRGGHSAFPHYTANAAFAAARFAAELADLADVERATAQPDGDFDPPWTSIHLGSIHAGEALNLVPDRAVLEYEIRSVPGRDVTNLCARIAARQAELRQDLQRQASEANIVEEPMASYPALDTPADHPVVATVGRLVEDPRPGSAVSFGTEAGIFAKMGVPMVVCGPGDISRAHKADEWIGVDELRACSAMMDRLARLLDCPVDEWISR